MSRYWRLVAKALGSKEGDNDKEADIVAFIRLLLIIQSVVTNIGILIFGIRHWRI